MKAYLSLLVLSFSFLYLQAQQMSVKQPNFTSFSFDKKIESEILSQKSSSEAKRHFEYGVVPFNTQCNNCVELIDNRTIDSRLFIDLKDEGHTYSQKSYFPLHYKKSENDIWRTIDFRLRPDAQNPNVFMARNQPVPTKCDLNRKITSLTESGFEFEFNKDLTLYFFDENAVYTLPEKGSYSNYSIGEEGLHVKSMWNGIDMQQQFRAGEIKTSYVISSPLQLPSNSGYMVIEDHFSLPQNFSFEEAANGMRLENGYYRGDYVLKNEKAEVLITCEKPIYLDAKAWGMHGMYKLLKNGNDYTLQTLVPVDWLNKSDNTYPLVIDPIVSGITKRGDFRLSGMSANMGFTTMLLGSCDYHMNVIVPGRSILSKAYVDMEYQLTYDNMCGSPALPPPFCTFSQVSMEVRNDSCNTTTGLLSCNPAAPPFTGTCTTDPNLVPGANSIAVNNLTPNYFSCIPPQCPDYNLAFTLKNRDSICGDVCGYLCARGNIWQMTVEAERDTNDGVLPIILTNDTLFAPSGYNTYQWYLNNNPILGADQQIYVPSQDGYYSVSLVSGSGSCLFAQGINYFLLTGFSSNQLIANKVSLYPNPAYTQLNIVNAMQATEICIYDLNGKKVLQEKFSKQIDISFLNAGMYFIEINGVATSVRKKFVKL